MEQLLRLSSMMRNNENGGTGAGGARQAGSIAAMVRLAMMNRDFNGNDYEVLQQLDVATSRSRGASESAINRLPVHIISAQDCEMASRGESGGDNAIIAPGNMSPSSSSLFSSNTSQPSQSSQSSQSTTNHSCSDRWTCSICLAPYEPGDRVKTTACMHRFHADCIDTWLRQKSICPVCKFESAV